jgi:RNA polymerase sigma-70 factor (ECF subfamily)
MDVMQPGLGRSTDVTAALTARRPVPEEVELGFDALYRGTVQDAYAYACTLLRDPSAAEEATALAFERAFRRRKSFDARRGSQRAWLFGIVRNAALDELRRRRRLRSLDSSHGPGCVEAGDGDLDEALEHALRKDALRGALMTLEARDRELIALKFHAGLSNADLARVLGVSETNAGTRLHRAITRLRRAFDETP